MNAILKGRPMKILHLEDSVTDHALVVRALKRAQCDFEICRIDQMADFQERVSSERFDIILADYRLAGFTALDAWAWLSTRVDPPPFVLLSGAIGEASAVEAIKTGMTDYVLKDDLTKIGHVIGRAIEFSDARKAKEKADAKLAASERQLSNLAEHLQSTIEEERASIAREIHDDIGGALAAVKFDLAWIGRHQASPDVLSHIASATEMLNHAIGASQRIMLNLRPAILDQGLEAGISWLAQNFEKRTSIKTLFRTSGKQESIPSSLQVVAYRTAQEALTNVSKHTKSSVVKIDLSVDQSYLTLEVTDDGAGIRDSDQYKPQSFGLRGMNERARNIGGWIDISTSPGGTSIILTAPLVPHSQISPEEHST